MALANFRIFIVHPLQSKRIIHLCNFTEWVCLSSNALIVYQVLTETLALMLQWVRVWFEWNCHQKPCGSIVIDGGRQKKEKKWGLKLERRKSAWRLADWLEQKGRLSWSLLVVAGVLGLFVTLVRSRHLRSVHCAHGLHGSPSMGNCHVSYS